LDLRGQEWYVRDPKDPYVQHEAEVCEFEPLSVANFESVSDGVAKIVGVSSDRDALKRAQLDMYTRFGGSVSATNSQSYYLDITNPLANKGMVVDYLSSKFGVPVGEIATIGDAQNDVAMFERSGLSIAMGNAEDDVKGSANEVTTSNEERGSRAPLSSSSCLSDVRNNKFQFTTDRAPGPITNATINQTLLRERTTNERLIN